MGRDGICLRAFAGEPRAPAQQSVEIRGGCTANRQAGMGQLRQNPYHWRHQTWKEQSTWRRQMREQFGSASPIVIGWAAPALPPKAVEVGRRGEYRVASRARALAQEPRSIIAAKTGCACVKTRSG